MNSDVIPTILATAAACVSLFFVQTLGHALPDVIFTVVLVFFTTLLATLLYSPGAHFQLAGMLVWSTHFILVCTHTDAHGAHEQNTCSLLQSLFVAVCCIGVIAVIVALVKRPSYHNMACGRVVVRIPPLVFITAAVAAPVLIFHSSCGNDEMLRGMFLRLLLFHGLLLVFKIAMIAAARGSDDSDKRHDLHSVHMSLALSILLAVLYLPFFLVVAFSVLFMALVGVVCVRRGLGGLSVVFHTEDNINDY